MKHIEIEWKHYAKEGETCTRCNHTGENVKSAIKKLTKNHPEIYFEYSETVLSGDQMAESNSILINNRFIEDILGLQSSENYCHSCTCLEGNNTNCRTIVSGKQTYEEIPVEFIELAIEKII